MPSPRLFAVCGLSVALAACGGSSDSSEAPTTTDAPTTTEAPTTTDAPTTEAPTTTDEIEPEVEPEVDDAALAEFCRASEQAYVANKVTYEVDTDPPSVRASLNFLQFTIDLSAQAAPAELAAEPQRAGALVGEISDTLAAYGDDIDALGLSGDIAALEPLVVELETIMEQLAGFLANVCGSPMWTLDDLAIKLAAVFPAAADWPLVPWQDASGLVQMYVPSAWSEVESLTDETAGVIGLQASADLAGYAETWDVAGVAAVGLFVDAGTADPLGNIELTLAGSCTEVSTVPYDDGVYAGELRRYEGCEGTETAVAILFATDSDAELEILVEFQLPPGTDPGVVDQVLATFAIG